jgi:hypothetical protein
MKYGIGLPSIGMMLGGIKDGAPAASKQHRLS